MKNHETFFSVHTYGTVATQIQKTTECCMLMGQGKKQNNAEINEKDEMMNGPGREHP